MALSRLQAAARTTKLTASTSSAVVTPKAEASRPPAAGLLVAARAGGRVILMDGYDGERMVGLLEDRRLDTVFAVPTVYQSLLEHPRFAAAPLAAADMRSASPSGSVPTLLLVIAGALALAALLAGVVFRFGNARRNDRQDFGRDQPAPWDSIDVGATIRSPPLATEAPTPQTGPARHRHDAVIPDEIVQLLSKLSREAAA